MALPPYAHTLSDRPEKEWEPLFTPFGPGEKECQKAACQKCRNLEPDHGHLNKVAYWTAFFAAAMFLPGSKEAESAGQWGWLAGIWHDLGKFAPEWQAYLKNKVFGLHEDEVSGKMDHATAGAVFTHAMKPCGELMAYVIAGHHSGLADGAQLFEERLKNKIPEWKTAAQAAGLLEPFSLPLPPLTRRDAGNAGLAFMTRFLYSCLVDADFLATEAFMQPDQNRERASWPEDVLERMLTILEKHLYDKFGNATGTVNKARASVKQACVDAAENATGFFSLTVPTGGGKTLMSLLFALRHARKHGLRRVIFVIPFTSIIKQNADVFRDVFHEFSSEMGREIVLEHHSKFDPAKETTQTRLSAENWDSPLVVTTNVQFFESLFANRSRGCRKLHRIARSVLIFDEVQALPLDLLAPILQGLRCLVKDLYCSAVLCTATQPALEKTDDFVPGLPKEEIIEIIPNRDALFRILKRTVCHNLGEMDDAFLTDHILSNSSSGCLVILNTTKAAQILHEKLSQDTTALHLSARMCPAHVIAVLDEAKALRKGGRPVVVVSTQIIEAGVDISFPAVYRAECGLDSFAQAAGRCNRNGELQDDDGNSVHGKVFLFQPLDHPIPKGLVDLTAAAGVTRAHILGVFDDENLLSLQAVRKFFEQAIWQAGPKTGQWDRHQIISGDMPCFPLQGMKAHQYKTAAERFRLIPSETHSVIIPWGEDGRVFAREIAELSKYKVPPRREHYRRAQQFTVQVYDSEWWHLQNRLDLFCEGVFPLLIHPENDYHPQTGLKRPAMPDDPSAFCL